MELDDFKDLMNTGALREPSNGSKEDPAGKFIEEMKEKDNIIRKALLSMVIVFAVFTGIYFTGIQSKNGLMRTGYLILEGGFIITLGYFLQKYRKHKKINYTAPIIEFLRSAERRYAYWPWPDLILAVLMIIALGLGGLLIVKGSFDKYFPGSWIPVGIYLIIYLSAVLVGTWAGKKQWEKQNKPVLDRIRQLLRDFEE